MRRNTILSLALFSLLLLAGAATAAEVPAQAEQAANLTAVVTAPVHPAATPAEAQPEAELCQILEATNTNVIEQAAFNYECPPGRWYCQRNAQCKGFCGVGQDHFAICQNGCCICTG